MRVRDDPERPDPGFAELYGSLPDATDLEPWLSWCREAAGAVLYLGVGAGRLAVPLVESGVELVGVDAHPGMLERLAPRAPGMELVHARIEELDLGRAFGLVIAPSNILTTAARLAGGARHVLPGGRLGFELMNPHWLAAGGAGGVRVAGIDGARARLEVDYGPDYVQEADVDLVWPEEIEGFLAGAGLTLEVMRGSTDDLETSSTFHVLARAPRRRTVRSVPHRRGGVPR
jgi:Methyltransferase domain